MNVFLTMKYVKLLSLNWWKNMPLYERNSLELIMHRKAIMHRPQLGKPRLKPTSNCTKSIKTFVISYIKGKEENIMSHWI